jgi:choline-glycine betaine transporter
VTATIFTSRTTSLVEDGHAPVAAATSGFHWGFVALVVFALLGARAALFIPGGAPREAEELEEQAALAA